eukprot:GHVT01051436.1.p2 GENE.GHVT01051436.1~~GHVT01051436.1.p2  ORF type:complete len:113 (-),score=16.23 GHVT01051436.1:1301-1639(-)
MSRLHSGPSLKAASALTDRSFPVFIPHSMLKEGLVDQGMCNEIRSTATTRPVITGSSRLPGCEVTGVTAEYLADEISAVSRAPSPWSQLPLTAAEPRRRRAELDGLNTKAFV